MERKKLIYFSIFNIAIVVIAVLIILGDLPNEQAVIYERFISQPTESDFISEVESITNNSAKISKSTTINSTASSSKKSSSQTTPTTSDTSITITENSQITFPINLNAATIEQLSGLDGIGETLAQRIIDYRSSIGGFTNRYQLLDVNGIGEKKLLAIYDFIYIENEQPLQTDTVQPEEQPPEYFEDTQPYVSEDIPAETSPIYINLNTATIEQLMTIPNMDNSTAQKIIDLRQQIQYFSHIYELLYVDTISESRLSQMQNYIYVE